MRFFFIALSTLLLVACSEIPEEAELTLAAPGEMGSMQTDLEAVRIILETNAIDAAASSVVRTEMVDGVERVVSVDLSGMNPPVHELPSEIARLNCVDTLTLSDNLIETLPPELLDMESLVLLNVSHNVLKRIPANIDRLPSLAVLDLSSNALATIPVAIGGLKESLKVLRVQNNQLSDLPTSVMELAHLEYLAMTRNRLCNLSFELCDWLTNTDQTDWGNTQVCGIPDAFRFRIDSSRTPAWIHIAQSPYADFNTYDLSALSTSGFRGEEIPDLLQAGVVAASLQFMESSNQHADISVFDVEASHRAAALYESTKADDSFRRFTNFPDIVARIDTTGFATGCLARAHFDKYFIEVGLSGYATRLNAYADAEMFIEVLEQMVQEG